MDYEVALISRIILEEKSKEVMDFNLHDDLFTTSLEEWRYVRDFYRRHGSSPPQEHFEHRFPEFEIKTTTAPISHLVEELQDRRAYNLIAEAMKESAPLLKAKRPKAAMEVYRKMVLNAENQTRTSKDVNVSDEPLKRLEEYQKIVEAGGITGVTTPWPLLDSVTMGFQPGELWMVVARGGIGKCIRNTSLIVDAYSGIQRTIEEVYNNANIQQITSWSKEKGIHTTPIFDKVDTGYKECLRIKLSSGRYIEATPEHPFLTPDGWKRADEICPGVTVGTPSKMPFPLEPKRIPYEELDFLALMLADGACTASDVRFIKSDESIVSIARDFAPKLGLVLRPTKAKDEYLFARDEGVDVNYGNYLLKKYELKGKKSIHKVVPEVIFRLGPKQLGRFISVFWMCDGYCTKSGLEIALSSKRLLEQFQSLLLRFGVQSRISYKKAKYQDGVNDSWRLRVYSHCYDDFAKNIPLWGHKGDNLQKLIVLDKNYNVGSPRISERLKKEIQVLSKSKAGQLNGSFHKKVAERLGRNSSFQTRDMFGNNNSLRLGTFRAFCEVYNVEERFSWLWNSDIFWDVVESNESVGEQKVYDLSIANTHCYVANDIIAHNTWMEVIASRYQWAVGYKPLLFTREMSVDQIVKRFDAAHAGVAHARLRSGQLTHEEYDKYQETLRLMEGAEPFWIVGDDEASSGISGILAKVDKYKPNIVWIDGVYLVEDERGAKSFWEKIKNVATDLQSGAKQKGIPFVVSHQFNQEGRDDKGTADTLAYGDLQKWFDGIIGMYQTEDLRVNKEMLFKLLKHREGERLDFVTQWDLENMIFDVKGIESDDVEHHEELGEEAINF